MKRALFLLFFYMAIFLIAGCSSQPQTDKPPAILYGEDACDECRMIINEERFASAYVTANNEVRRFDDIGCMLRYQEKHPEEIGRLWIHDYENQNWLEADKAFFILSDRLTTPMGYGIVAVGEKAVADSLAKSYFGRVLNWDEVMQQFKSFN